MEFTEDSQHWVVSILCIVTWINLNLKFAKYLSFLEGFGSGLRSGAPDGRHLTV